MLSSFINQATADDGVVEHNPPEEVRGSARPASDELVAHPFTRLQLSTSEVGKPRASTEVRFDVELTVDVLWNNVVVPETRSAGSVAS